MKNYNLKVTYVLSALVLTGVALSGCSRDNGKSSDVSIDVSSLTGVNRSAGQQATALSYIQHIAINIRDNNGKLLVSPINWDSDCHCFPRVQNPAPTSFAITLPNGTKNTLVQVIVAGSDTSATGSTTFFRYGDATVDMSGLQNQTANVVESTIAVGNGTSGSVVGKFMESSAGSGRTGRVIMQIVPPGGKPPVAIQTNDIFGGWFNINVIDGMVNRYVFEDGTTMFDSISLSSGTLQVNGSAVTASGSVVGIDVPLAYNLQNSVCTLNRSTIQYNYFGFFGGALASAAKVVLPTSNQTQSGYFDSPACTNALGWSATAFGDGSSVDRFVLGSGASAGPGTAFSNIIALNPSQMTNSTYTAGFQSAYQLNAINQPLTLIQSANSLTTAWTYLNNEALTGATPVSGTEIFYKKYASNDASFFQLNNGNGTTCDLLPAMGFTSAGLTSGSTSSMTIQGIAATDSVGVFACPFQNNIAGISKRYFLSAGLSSFNIGGMGSGSATLNLASATQIVLSTYASVTTVGTGACIPIHVATRAANGALGVLPASNWSWTGAGYNMFYDPACSAPTSNLPNVVNDTFYLKMMASSLLQSFSMSAGGITSTPISYIATTSVVSPNGLALSLDRPSVNIGECAAGSVSLTGSLGFLSSYSSPVSVTMTPSNAGIYLWSDTTCSGSTQSTIGIVAGSTSALFRFKATGTPVTISVSSTPGSGSGSVIASLAGAISQMSLWASAPGASANYNAPLIGTLTANACYPLFMQFLDSSWLPSPLASASSFTVTSSDPAARFSNNPSCSGSSNPYLGTSSSSTFLPIVYMQYPSTGVTFPVFVSYPSPVFSTSTFFSY